MSTRHRAPTLAHSRVSALAPAMCSTGSRRCALALRTGNQNSEVGGVTMTRSCQISTKNGIDSTIWLLYTNNQVLENKRKDILSYTRLRILCEGARNVTFNAVGGLTCDLLWPDALQAGQLLPAHKTVTAP